MKKTIKYILASTSIIVFGLTSCNKYLDRQLESSYTQRDYYKNSAEVEAALIGVYNAIGARTISPGFGNPTPYYAKMDLYTELGLERGLSGTIASGTYDVTNGTVAELWAGFYQVIQRANNTLFYMQQAKAVMPAADYARVQAEAKVIRAMAYWHLIAYYGDIPFLTEPPTQEQLSSIRRTSKKTIIDFLLKDLEGAAASLNWLPEQAGRVSKGVAMGLGARLAMLDGNYNYAATITDNIIANGPYSLNPVYENLFRKNGQASNVANEIMWYYPFGDADAGSFNYLQLVQGSRNNGGQSSHFPSQFMVDLYECRDGQTIATSPLYNPARPNQNRDPRMRHSVFVPGDTMIVQGFTSIIFNFTSGRAATFNPTTRAIAFPSSVTNQDSSNPFGPRLNGNGNLWKKYSADRDVNGTAGNLYKVGWLYMRFAEILLINAEAHAEKGSPASTIATSVNRVRARAGMPNVSAAVLANPTALKNLVRKEKMVELANEGLHMADLRRWDNGAYAARVMPGKLYGQAISGMSYDVATGLSFISPAPTPTFDATYNVPISWPNGDATRLSRETRIFNSPQHLLCPIPQGERDKVSTLTQNPGW
jgi:hypothetical protein